MPCQGQEVQTTNVIPAVHQGEAEPRGIEKAVFLPAWIPTTRVREVPPPFEERLILTIDTEISIKHDPEGHGRLASWLFFRSQNHESDLARRAATLRFVLAEIETILPVLRGIVAELD